MKNRLLDIITIENGFVPLNGLLLVRIIRIVKTELLRMDVMVWIRNAGQL